MRILVVDDDNPTRKLVEIFLTKWGYEFASARDGAEAWEIWQKETFDLIISDWLMPEMDGPELCRRIRSVEREGYTYFILCSVRGSTEHIVEGIEAGADDYIIKPFEQAELKVRIEAGRRLLDRERSHASITARLKRGLEQAAVTLTGMLPVPRTGPDMQIDWLFRPCSIIGGDLFNVLAVDEKHVVVYAIDVSGHGVASALFAVTLGNMLLPRPQIGEFNAHHASRSNQFSWNCSPLRVVSTLSERFPFEHPTNMYSTLFYAVIERQTLKMSWVRAGHPPPLVVSNSNKYLLEDGDPPIGLFPEYEFTEHTTHLHRGDRLYLYSDGITEAKAPDAELFGADRLISLLCNSTPDQPLGDVVRQVDNAVLEHRGDDQFDDDLSLLAVEMI